MRLPQQSVARSADSASSGLSKAVVFVLKNGHGEEIFETSILCGRHDWSLQ